MSYDPNDPVRRIAGWGLWYVYWRVAKFALGWTFAASMALFVALLFVSPTFRAAVVALARH